MKAILFSKMLKDKSPEELVKLALSWGIGGYDLCVRPGHPVNPDNVSEALPRAAGLFRANGLDIPMVTAPGDLVEPDQPAAKTILAAMDKADMRLLKIGYFVFDPKKQSYIAEVERIRRIFAQWQSLSRQYGVKICYHTHSNSYMGLNGASMAHLLAGSDPACLGAYIDPGHLVVEGENFATAAAMVRDYLSIVSVKDVRLERVEKNGHGSIEQHWVEAGKGMVDWSAVFECLTSMGFEGPVTVHCEFRAKGEEFLAMAEREIAFFKRSLNG